MQGPPNVVLIVTDDQGYGDLGCFGHPTIRTPRIDALAAGGAKLTQFYAGAPVCSPSRAAFLTGCYPKRVGMHRHVVFPMDDFGLHPDEETLAELLRAQGYRTGCFGKWHLGHHEGLLPTDQGFDAYEGVPYSNDMAQFHRRPGTKYNLRLPWMRDAEVLEWEPDQSFLTKRQTDAAIEFLAQGGSGAKGATQPFFVYVPFSMPHVPIYASEDFAEKSARGPYGDVIEEIDASVGRIVDALEASGQLENTLVIFTSDNGPWLEYGLDGGSAGPLRGGKGTIWEGGVRVPFVAHWPSRIPAGHVLQEVVTAMDVAPTVLALASVPAALRPLDGRDVSAALTAQGPVVSQPLLLYTSGGEAAGIRRGHWKLHLESGQLFDVEADVGESLDVSGDHPDLVRDLEALALRMDAEIEANARPRSSGNPQVMDPRVPSHAPRRHESSVGQ